MLATAGTHAEHAELLVYILGYMCVLVYCLTGTRAQTTQISKPSVCCLYVDGCRHDYFFKIIPTYLVRSLDPLPARIPVAITSSVAKQVRRGVDKRAKKRAGGLRRRRRKHVRRKVRRW